jgi:Domain of unknown function (DUF4159)/Prenyltransferase and squalene oxidase repeat
MTRGRLPCRFAVILAAFVSLVLPSRCFAADISSKGAIEAIEKAKRFLLKAQQSDGSWRAHNGGETWKVGITSLAMLALINTGMTAQDKEISRGLAWLRQQDPTGTYEISLMIQALAAAKDGRRDVARVLKLTGTLEATQLRGGPGDGSWTYGGGMPNLGGDRSNAQFAVLGLREAQEMGVPVSLDTWRRARTHWLNSQNGDGGWGYSGGAGSPSTGSMTVAGIATVVITEAMVRAEQKETNPDGTPNCCTPSKPEKALEDAARWMGNHFTVGHNFGGNQWLLYYLYGLERAGRFSGRRFFTNNRGERHDWYREGAEYLVSQQNRLTGAWSGHGQMENDPVLGTSFALMFLSKGLAPVLMNKLQHGPRDSKGRSVAGNNWNHHHNDVRNLTQLISNLDRWPRLLTWQVVDVAQANVNDLLQAPILFMNGSEALRLTPEDVALLKDYVLQGGFILAVNCCKSAAFDESFRDLIRQMYPPAEAQLRKLDATHPVFRAEYPLLDPQTGQPTAELWGVDVGCRTSIMYSPDDISCLWDKWTSFEVPRRTKEMNSMITKATRVGVNIVAYVTGRELIDKLTRSEQVVVDAGNDRIERDLLQIAKMRYTGDWDAAPQALHNLLLAMNRTVGLSASTKHRDLTLVDPNLFKYPILYMHGRHDFALSRPEVDKLRNYVTQGGVLFADACCGAAPFDRSFRRLVEQLYPEEKLKRIPADHELFSSKIGHDLRLVKRREPDVDNGESSLQVSVRSVEPFFEGIEIDGRFVVIYSKYDLSCALERQASVACTGYIHEDAVRLGVNIILYALLQ